MDLIVIKIKIKKKKKINLNNPGHRYFLDYNLLKSYCISRKINFKYSIKNKDKLENDISKYEPLFEISDFINIENPNKDIIKKCKNFNERVRNYINKV